MLSISQRRLIVVHMSKPNDVCMFLGYTTWTTRAYVRSRDWWEEKCTHCITHSRMGEKKKSAERVSLAYLVRRTYGSVVRVADRSRRIGHASMAQICTADAHPVGSHAAHC